MEKTLSGKYALVTGGARGIGRAICLKLASLGSNILVNDVPGAPSTEETVKLCRELGVQAEVCAFDVSDSAAVESAFEGLRSKPGRLDILVNNAGISRDNLLIRFKDEDWSKTLAVNLTGAFNCARAAAALMMKARWGRIINIASVVGQMGNGGQAAYSASKAGMIGLTKTIAREIASRNVTVNAIAPGFITTDMTQALDEKVKAEHLKSIPLGRYGDPGEVANLVAFLAGDEAAYITGQVIGINGGMYM